MMSVGGTPVKDLQCSGLFDEKNKKAVAPLTATPHRQ